MMFSVVICTYNRAHQVGTAIDSVLAQTFDDYELIVVNDGSTDDTADALGRYEHPHLRVVNRSNGGLSAARNSGIEAATGRFVAFLDDDDTVSPRWLAGLARGVDDATGFTACAWTIEFKDPPARQVVPPRSHVLFPDVKGGFMPGCFALDRDVLLTIGGYAEEIKVSHQSELLLRALPEVKRRGMTTAITDEPLVTIERRRPENRPLAQPAELLHGAEYLLRHHSERLAERPAARANYHTIAGVAAARLGDLNLARCHLRQAIVTNPRQPKHLVRYAVALVPPVARRAWRVPGAK